MNRFEDLPQWQERTTSDDAIVHRARLKKGDLEVEFSGTRGFVEEQLERVAGSFGLQPLEGTQVSPTFSVRKNLSFEGFTELKGPNSDLDRLLVLAYFLEKYEGIRRYSREDLQRHWEANFADHAFEPGFCDQAAAGGYFSWESPDTLTLSFSGEVYVQNGLA